MAKWEYDPGKRTYSLHSIDPSCGEWRARISRIVGSPAWCWEITSWRRVKRVYSGVNTSRFLIEAQGDARRLKSAKKRVERILLTLQQVQD